MITIQIKYFGQIAEITQKLEEKLEITSDKFLLSALKTKLESKYLQLETVDYSMAINQEIADQSQQLQHNDEVAFLPPFAGG